MGYWDVIEKYYFGNSALAIRALVKNTISGLIFFYQRYNLKKYCFSDKIFSL